MAVPIYTEVLQIPEDDFRDPFFGDTTIPNGTAVDDKRKPDHKRYIMHNIDNCVVHSINRVNIPSPCRYRRHLSNFGRSSKFTPPPHSGNNYIDNFQGVYIVDKYELFPTAGKYGNKELINMIQSILIDLNKDEVDAIINNFVHRSPQTAGGYHIRLIYFIPKDVLIKNLSIYHKQCDIVITLRTPNETTYHPESRPAQRLKANERITKYAEPNIIAIDITNVDNPNKHYNMKIGNTVYKLKSTTNEKTPSGYSLVIKHLGDIIDNKSGGLDELTNAGIYETYEEAEYNGNSDLVLKYATLESTLKSLETKKESELIKLDNEKLKIEGDKNKLNIDYRKTKLEYENTKEKYRQEKKKRKDERLHMREKHNNELKLIKLKHEHEIALQEQKYKQAILEYDKKLLDIKQTIIKFELDMTTTKRKSYIETKILEEKRAYDKEFYNIKIVNEQNKLKSDKFKGGMDILSKGITLITAYFKQ